MEKPQWQGRPADRDLISTESVAEEECAFWVPVCTNHLLPGKATFLNDKKASGQTLQPLLMVVVAMCPWLLNPGSKRAVHPLPANTSVEISLHPKLWFEMPFFFSVSCYSGLFLVCWVQVVVGELFLGCCRNASCCESCFMALGCLASAANLNSSVP